MNLQETVVKRINELCKTQNINYYTLAYRSAIAKSSLMNIIYGTTPTISTISKICDGFGISLKDFFDSDYFLSYDDLD